MGFQALNNDQVSLASRVSLRKQSHAYELTPHDYLVILRESRRVFFLVITISLLIGGSIAFLSSPVYIADSLIKVQEETSTISALEQVNTLFGGESQANAEVEFINSRLVLGKAVDNLRLDIVAVPRYFPLIGEFIYRHYNEDIGTIAEPLLGLGNFCWGGESIDVKELVVPSHLSGITLTLVAQPNDRYQLYDPEGVLLLEGATNKVAKALVDGQEMVLNVTSIHARPGSEFQLTRYGPLAAIKDLKDRFSVTEIGRQSNILKVTLSGSDKERTSNLLNEIVRIYVDQNTSFRSVEAHKALVFLEGQLPELRSKVEKAEEALNEFRLQQGSVDLPTETQSILKSIVTVDAQITELSRNRDDLRQKFTPKHPSVLALDTQIWRLRQERKELESKVKDLPETQQQILRLSRDVEVATKLYTVLLENVQELRIANANNIGNIQVIDFALTPEVPSKPRKGIILLISVLVGLIVSIIIIFLRQGLGRGVTNPKQIEAELHTPVVADIPYSKIETKLARKKKRKEEHGILFNGQNAYDSAITELRGLYTTIVTQLHLESCRSMVVCGTKYGDGSTFVSANLGAISADAGESVCLIDANYQNDDLAEYFNIENSKGLSDVIQGLETLSDVIQKTSVENLHLIPSGLINKPLNMRMRGNMGDLLGSLTRSYDRIIIDTSPIELQAEALFLGRYVDLTLLIAKVGAYSILELERSVGKLRQSGIEQIGIVLNSKI